MLYALLPCQPLESHNLLLIWVPVFDKKDVEESNLQGLWDSMSPLHPIFQPANDHELIPAILLKLSRSKDRDPMQLQPISNSNPHPRQPLGLQEASRGLWSK